MSFVYKLIKILKKVVNTCISLGSKTVIIPKVIKKLLGIFLIASQSFPIYLIKKYYQTPNNFKYNVFIQKAVLIKYSLRIIYMFFYYIHMYVCI